MKLLPSKVPFVREIKGSNIFNENLKAIKSKEKYLNKCQEVFCWWNKVHYSTRKYSYPVNSVFFDGPKHWLSSRCSIRKDLNDNLDAIQTSRWPRIYDPLLKILEMYSVPSHAPVSTWHLMLSTSFIRARLCQK